MKKRRTSSQLLKVDKLALGYLGCTGLIFLFYAYEGLHYLQFGVIHIICIAVIYWLAKREHLPHPMPVLRYCYPVLLLTLVYFEVQMLSELIYNPDFSYDVLVERWDALVFGFNPHIYWSREMPGWFWTEFFHLLYLSYYPLLIGSFIWVWNNRAEDYNRFAFVYLGIFLTFIVCFIFFPVYGPMEYRENQFDDIGIFPRLVDLLFSIGESNGGAFPSSHVGQSVGIYMLLRPMNLAAKLLIAGIILGIGLSMIYGSIHYAVDAVAGVFAGWLAYTIWNRFYDVL